MALFLLCGEIGIVNSFLLGEDGQGFFVWVWGLVGLGHPCPYVMVSVFRTGVFRLGLGFGGSAHEMRNEMG